MPNMRVRRAFYREVVVHLTQEEYDRDEEGAASRKANLVPDSAWDDWGFDRDEDSMSDTDDPSYDGYDESNTCTNCGRPTDDGEGYDGLCGNCADKANGEDDEG